MFQYYQLYILFFDSQCITAPPQGIVKGKVILIICYGMLNTYKCLGLHIVIEYSVIIGT